MFAHFAIIAARMVKIMAPEDGVANDLITNSARKTDVEYVVDSQLPKGQYNLQLEELSINGASLEDIKKYMSTCSSLRSISSEEIKNVINALSFKKADDEISDLKSGAYTFALIFANDVESLKNLEGVDRIQHIRFYLFTKKEDADKYGVPFPGVLAYSTADRNWLKMPFRGKLDALVASISIPAFSPISQENFRYFQSLDQKLFYVIDSARSFEENKNDFNEVAKQCSSFAKFIFFTPEDVPALIPLLKLQSSDYPILLSLAREGKGIVRSLKPETFLNGVQSLITQSAEKIVFSSNIPEDNESRPVKVLSTETLPQVLSSSDKDVLIAFTSPSCKFCQALEPELKDFGKILSERNVPILVGNYNIMENEEPASQFEIAGVPTIYFLKKGASTPSKVPSNIRSVPQLLEYISKEGTTSKINLDEYSEYLKVQEKAEPSESEHSEHAHKEESEEDGQKEIL
ncbi:uncharacterized protein VICG_00990 [Vittaforma corneae ATCC 50505]|uniref:Thioredoxin domain-containing protein n=1 Tax=Vittaforma corneae (strain ATCC 50505) TaxID=993615 RepID=L2GM55_VITCO|nr:uncharacterized protein VICG_00990 [Vittaforma corneae ATCC 50505]ELA41973.1 hypothetical protein VICG_00990 [Vittaforma corneae ATCC 50505]